MGRLAKKALNTGKAVGSGLVKTGVMLGVEAAAPHVRDAAINAVLTAAEFLDGKPSVEAFNKRISSLQAKRQTMEDEARLLGKEISSMKKTLKRHEAGNIIERRRFKRALREKLVLQYGLYEYISLLLDGAKGKGMSTEAVRFFKVYGKHLDRRSVSEYDWKKVEDYIDSLHKAEILLLYPQETSSKLKELWRYGS